MVTMREAVLELPPLYPRQREAIFSPKRFSLIEAGTKTGKTLGCAIWLVAKAWEEGGPGTRAWWVAPVYPQAEIGYRRLKDLLPRDLVKCTDYRLEIVLPNGAEIQCRSAEKPDNLFGEGVKWVVLDEASRVREDSWFAVRTTLTATKGVARVIGNPKGKKNWFWKWGARIRSGQDDEAVYHHLRTADNPFIDRKEIEAARASLPAHVFAELYEGMAQDEETNVFSRIEKHFFTGRTGYDTRYRHAAGLDLGRVQDSTVLTIMRCETDGTRDLRPAVFIDRFKGIGWNVQRQRIASALFRFGNPPCVMDSTGLGDPVFDELKAMGANVIPYRFTNESKRILVESLLVAWDKDEVQIPNDRTLVGELEAFEYRLSPSGRPIYEASEGSHDDMVISLALANWAATIRPAYWHDGRI